MGRRTLVTRALVVMMALLAIGCANHYSSVMQLDIKPQGTGSISPEPNSPGGRGCPARATQTRSDKVSVCIVKHGWSTKIQPNCLFVLNPTDRFAFSEIFQKEYKLWSRRKDAYESPVLSFEVKAIEVSNDQRLGTFEGEATANFSCPSESSATRHVEDEPKQGTVVESSNYDGA